jgi:hypothetical protein
VVDLYVGELINRISLQIGWEESRLHRALHAPIIYLT